MVLKNLALLATLAHLARQQDGQLHEIGNDGSKITNLCKLFRNNNLLRNIGKNSKTGNMIRGFTMTPLDILAWLTGGGFTVTEREGRLWVTPGSLLSVEDAALVRENREELLAYLRDPTPPEPPPVERARKAAEPQRELFDEEDLRWR